MYTEFPLYNSYLNIESLCKTLRHGVDVKHKGKTVKKRRLKNRIAKKSKQKNR